MSVRLTVRLAASGIQTSRFEDARSFSCDPLLDPDPSLG